MNSDGLQGKPIKAGAEIACPHCGKDSFAVAKAVMDGWRKVGEALVCAACSREVGTPPPPVGTSGGAAGGNGGAARLADLLGGDSEFSKPSLEAMFDGDTETRFCRDCSHLVSHPFQCRCSLHGREVAPMEDCPDFSRKPSLGG